MFTVTVQYCHEGENISIHPVILETLPEPGAFMAFDKFRFTVENVVHEIFPTHEQYSRDGQILTKCKWDETEPDSMPRYVISKASVLINTPTRIDNSEFKVEDFAYYILHNHYVVNMTDELRDFTELQYGPIPPMGDFFTEERAIEAERYREWAERSLAIRETERAIEMSRVAEEIDRITNQNKPRKGFFK